MEPPTSDPGYLATSSKNVFDAMEQSVSRTTLAGIWVAFFSRRQPDNYRCSQATKFYDEYANKCVANGHAVDLYSCALDQCGVMEMRKLVNQTGGYFLIAEAFEHPTFKNSLAKSFASDDKQVKSLAILRHISSRFE